MALRFLQTEMVEKRLSDLPTCPLKQVISHSCERHTPHTWRKRNILIFEDDGWMAKRNPNAQALLSFPQFTTFSSYPFCPPARFSTTLHSSPNLVQKCSSLAVSLGLHFHMQALKSHNTYIN